jgi:hypothetical protein
MMMMMMMTMTTTTNTMTMATSTRTTVPSFQFVFEGSRRALPAIGVLVGTWLFV